MIKKQTLQISSNINLDRTRPKNPVINPVGELANIPPYMNPVLQTAKVGNMLSYATGCAPGKLIKKKILPRYFAEVVSGIKTFELRKDENDIQQGDTLDLLEWDQGYGYSGRGIRCRVTYVLRNCPEYGLMDGYCIIGIEAVCMVAVAD